MTEQQKPLEEGYFWVRVEDDSEWEPAEIWMKPDGTFDSCTVMSSFPMNPKEMHQVGPRLTPPQEKEDRDKVLSDMQQYDAERGRV